MNSASDEFGEFLLFHYASFVKSKRSIQTLSNVYGDLNTRPNIIKLNAKVEFLFLETLLNKQIFYNCDFMRSPNWNIIQFLWTAFRKE